MLIDRFRVCWLKVHAEKDKRFHFTLPISFYALEELLDCASDILDFVCLFVPRNAAPNSHGISNIPIVRELLPELIRLLGRLPGTEPYDLIDVEADHIKVSIKFR